MLAKVRDNLIRIHQFIGKETFQEDDHKIV